MILLDSAHPDKLLYTTSSKHYIPVNLPWIFPGAPLNFNGDPRNIQGNLDRKAIMVSCHYNLHTTKSTRDCLSTKMASCHQCANPNDFSTFFSPPGDFLHMYWYETLFILKSVPAVRQKQAKNRKKPVNFNVFHS